MPSGQRVYVGNIGSDIRERDLEKFFKGFGRLGEISIKNGYGFVDFDDYRDADDAVHDLDGKDLRGSRYPLFILTPSVSQKKIISVHLEFVWNWQENAVAALMEVVIAGAVATVETEATVEVVTVVVVAAGEAILPVRERNTESLWKI